MKNKSKNWFSYVVVAAVLIIPFIYSFFYLKAYWNPYGKGNLDNLPVAIVNEDTGDKGETLVKTLQDSNTLKLDVVDSDQANDGLYDKKYYAVITIPKDFTSDMESAGTKNKKHPTITYSPNQKSNYLASQIIDKVITKVELSLDNQINAEIDGNLTDKLNEVPNSLNTISTGFSKLESGTKELNSGSKTLSNGLALLDSKYQTFSNGLNNVVSGSNTLYSSYEQLNGGINSLANSTKELSTLASSISDLTTGVDTLNNYENDLNQNINNYVDSVNNTLKFSKNAALVIKQTYEQAGNTDDELYKAAVQILNSQSVDKLTASGTAIKSYSNSIATNINDLNQKVQGFSGTGDKINSLNNAINTIQAGSNKVYSGMSTINNGLLELSAGNKQISSAMKQLTTGSITLTNGTDTLNKSVSEAKTSLDKNIEETKDELTVLDDLKDYSKNPVKVTTKEVNKVSSYGTAFSPFFISIALWVGALMMFIVLYYDKEERFPILSINNENHLQRTLCYHGLATASGVLLGILLNLFLNFEITNYFLYYISLILVSNMFMAIMELLIVNFKDIGKFMALILLVLQLAAAGGTFPIETVTKGFRFLNGILPMTYTINLLKESLISIESSILTKNLLIVCSILLVVFVINIVRDVMYKKNSK